MIRVTFHMDPDQPIVEEWPDTVTECELKARAEYHHCRVRYTAELVEDDHE